MGQQKGELLEAARTEHISTSQPEIEQFSPYSSSPGSALLASPSSTSSLYPLPSPDLSSDFPCSDEESLFRASLHSPKLHQKASTLPLRRGFNDDEKRLTLEYSCKKADSHVYERRPLPDLPSSTSYGLTTSQLRPHKRLPRPPEHCHQYVSSPEDRTFTYSDKPLPPLPMAEYRSSAGRSHNNNKRDVGCVSPRPASSPDLLGSFPEPPLITPEMLTDHYGEVIAPFLNLHGLQGLTMALKRNCHSQNLCAVQKRIQPSDDITHGLSKRPCHQRTRSEHLFYCLFPHTEPKAAKIPFP